MGMWIGRNRKARVTYGFDEIALVPGSVTINPNEVDTTFRLPRREGPPLELKIPILASAMDGGERVFCRGNEQAWRFGGAQSRRSADALQESLGSARENRADGQERNHRSLAKNLPGTGAAGIDRGAGAANQGWRRDRSGEFDSATRGGIWRHRPGSGRRCFRGAKHGLNCASHFFGI